MITDRLRPPFGAGLRTRRPSTSTTGWRIHTLPAARSTSPMRIPATSERRPPVPSRSSKTRRSCAVGNRVSSRSMNRKSGTTISRTLSWAGSTVRRTSAIGLCGSTPWLTSQLQNARSMSQCVRSVFGARPAASIDRKTSAMSLDSSVCGSRSPIDGDHQVRHCARSRALVDAAPPRLPPTLTTDRRASFAACQRSNHSSQRTPLTATLTSTSGGSSETRSGSSAGRSWVIRHRAWARTASSSVSKMP